MFSGNMLDMAMEGDKLAEINRKIAEIKKRILLAEGQKTANTAEWQKQNHINCETIATLKKEIKELTTKCGRLRNPLQRSVILRDAGSASDLSKPNAAAAIIVGKMKYPIGAKSASDAIVLTDLKITEYRKAIDLLRHKFACRKQRFDQLMEQYHELVSAKEAQSQNAGEKPPETIEEDSNRKLVCQLENEIHRTTVQWMEAEHIRKKYRSIEASLMNDSERFERSLRELEESLNQQQAEINDLQQVHNEAIEMRDAAKVILQRQEQQANLSQKTRDRQAMEFRKHVEQRKLELERIGRKLFVESKTLVHQDSAGSSIGDPMAAHSEHDDDHKSLEDSTSDMENLFKYLMEVTGAVRCEEVLTRFSSQKESAVRLTYLRNAAETEKSELEALRENLTKELEASKFSDVKETEINQEVVEQIKLKIADLEEERQKNVEAANKTLAVLKYIKERICELIFRLQEVDESDIVLKRKNIVIRIANLPKFLTHEAEDIDLIDILNIKQLRGQELIKEADTSMKIMERSELETQDSSVQFYVPSKVSESEKPQPIPLCYYNLLTGRSQRTGGTSSSSPEQAPQAAATNEEENEVPSRNFLKRQSVLIVDSKSRRKGFRGAPAARRK